MKAYIIPTDIKISPFDDPVSCIPVLNEPLADYQAHTLGKFRINAQLIMSIEEMDDAPCLVLMDNVFFTGLLVKKFLHAIKDKTKPVRLGIKDCLFIRKNSALQDIHFTDTETGKGDALYNFFYFPHGRADALELLPKFAGTFHSTDHDPGKLIETCLISVKERQIALTALEKHGDVKTENTAFSLEACFQLNHWSHILPANLYAYGAFWRELPFKRFLVFFLKSLSTISFNKYRMLNKFLRKLVIKGRNCNIHPSAVVEASVLGDNVKIGAFSVVRGAYIGSGATLDDYSHVNFSVIGEQAGVSFRTTLNMAVLFAGAFVSTPGVQATVMGRKSIFVPGSIIMDVKLEPSFDKEVTVIHKGRAVSSGRKFLGAAVGHGAIIASGIWVNSGVAIPNNSFVIRNPSQVLRKLEPGLPEKVPLIVENGILRRL